MYGDISWKYMKYVLRNWCNT